MKNEDPKITRLGRFLRHPIEYVVKTVPKDDFDKMGLVVGTKGRMYYGYKHGFGGWLPHWAKHGISYVWNVIVCWKIGHDVFTYPDDAGRHAGETWCVSCDKRLPTPPPCRICGAKPGERCDAGLHS